MFALGQSLCRSNDTIAGIALLEEAVAGQTAVRGAGHPSTKDAREWLDWAKSEVESEESQEPDGEEEEEEEEDDEEEEEEEEEEAIAGLTRKRRRRA